MLLHNQHASPGVLSHRQAALGSKHAFHINALRATCQTIFTTIEGGGYGSHLNHLTLVFVFVLFLVGEIRLEKRRGTMEEE